MALGFQSQPRNAGNVHMKIYLAGGFSVALVPDRERELIKKFNHWNRLHSYWYLEMITKSKILQIKREENENLFRYLVD